MTSMSLNKEIAKAQFQFQNSDIWKRGDFKICKLLSFYVSFTGGRIKLQMEHVVQDQTNNNNLALKRKFSRRMSRIQEMIISYYKEIYSISKKQN